MNKQLLSFFHSINTKEYKEENQFLSTIHDLNWKEKIFHNILPAASVLFQFSFITITFLKFIYYISPNLLIPNSNLGLGIAFGVMGISFILTFFITLFLQKQIYRFIIYRKNKKLAQKKEYFEELLLRVIEDKEVQFSIIAFSEEIIQELNKYAHINAASLAIYTSEFINILNILNTEYSPSSIISSFNNLMMSLDENVKTVMVLKERKIRQQTNIEWSEEHSFVQEFKKWKENNIVDEEDTESEIELEYNYKTYL